MNSYTAVRITAIKHVEIPPAIAEVTTSLGETFPIFDVAIRCATVDAMDAGTLVLPVLGDARGCRIGYLRGFYPIDAHAQTMVCPWCSDADAWNARVPQSPAWFHEPDAHSLMMVRHEAGESNGSVPQFACPRCSRRIYLEPIKPVAMPDLPTQARARLDRVTDGVFALDHLHHTATLMDSFDGSISSRRPFHGVTAQLEPFRESHAFDSLGFLNEGGLMLRLMGDPFHGRTSYQVL